MLTKVTYKSSNNAYSLPENYRPSEDETFMSGRQLAYFEKILTDWKNEILQANRNTLRHLHDDSNQYADIADRATAESDKTLELRTRDRQRKLISKIDDAIERIHDGSYGYCMETDEQIGLRRLEARPIATLSIEAQERHEKKERIFRN